MGSSKGELRHRRSWGKLRPTLCQSLWGDPPQMGSANNHLGREEQQLEEELPGVAVSCQPGFESGGASRPPDAPVHPHLLGVAGVVPGQALYLPGPCTPELRVRPSQVGGLAEHLGQFRLHRSPPLQSWPSGGNLGSSPRAGDPNVQGSALGLRLSLK